MGNEREFDPAVRVFFKHFWIGFDPNDFFIPFLNASKKFTFCLTNSESSADLIFMSSYKSLSAIKCFLNILIQKYSFLYKFSKLYLLIRRYKPLRSLSHDNSNIVKIFYTAENIRPSLDFDLNFTFDRTSDSLKNIYFPFWFLIFEDTFSEFSINNSSQNRSGVKMKIAEAIAPRKYSDINLRKKFACIFTNHKDPMRLNIVKMLSKIDEVDVFGAVTNNFIEAKFDVAKNYRFMICLENDLYPGYVTEKVFDAWFCGCVPIWWGDDTERFLNSNAMININDFHNVDELQREILNLNNSPEKLIEISKKPILLKRPTLDEKLSALEKLLEKKFRNIS